MGVLEAHAAEHVEHTASGQAAISGAACLLVALQCIWMWGASVTSVPFVTEVMLSPRVPRGVQESMLRSKVPANTCALQTSGTCQGSCDCLRAAWVNSQALRKLKYSRPAVWQVPGLKMGR